MDSRRIWESHQNHRLQILDSFGERTMQTELFNTSAYSIPPKQSFFDWELENLGAEGDEKVSRDKTKNKTSSKPQKAFMILSVEPAMAWAIAHLGKRTENRSMRTHYRGLLLIHASKSKTHYKQHREWIENMGYQCPEWEDLPKGVVVAQCFVTGCSSEKADIDCGWGMAGNYWWHLDGVSLVEQFPLKGRPGLPFSVELDEEVKPTANLVPIPLPVANRPSKDEPEGDTFNSPSKTIPPSSNLPGKRPRGKGGSGSIYWRTVTRNSKNYRQAYYHWRDGGRKRTKYIRSRLLGQVTEAVAQNLPVTSILALLGVVLPQRKEELRPENASCPSKEVLLGDNNNCPSNNSCPSKTDTPSTKSRSKRQREKGKGNGYIHWRLSQGKYLQAYYHYEIWENGERKIKSSKYIPKRLVAKIQMLDEGKAPVKKILAVLGIKIN